MYKDEKISVLANISKIAVDCSLMTHEKKEFVKNSIDIVAELIKMEVRAEEDTIRRIQDAARYFDLDRVVAFPCIVHGKNSVLFRMSGGAIPLFCRYMGFSQLSENDIPVSPIYIAQMEQQYGVVIYERQ